MDYLSEYLSVKWLVGAFLNFVIGVVLLAAFKLIPRLGMQWMQSGRVKRLRKIRRIRFNSVAVNYEIMISGVYFVLFLSSVVLTVCLIAFTSYVGDVELTYIPLVVSLYATPVFVFEVLWLEQNFFVRMLIRFNPYSHRGKKRINRATQRSARRDRERALRRSELGSLKYRQV
ncbi:hypothetical protein MHB_0008290 [Pseudomonas fluorescens BBc6R8]|uniref:hypothetical protein n=1 Tax=Pseudomonas fluorescens TaxID=294 RepID=UPI000281C7B1|nr:hypothetical protein [Pseudomonas fluorescens]QQD56235.1 hypothetical protein MHB_0008290 [Pseudomonas fluorescens BBc6R8]